MTKSAAVLEAAESWFWERGQGRFDTDAEWIEHCIRGYTGDAKATNAKLSASVAEMIKERAEDTRR